MPSVRHVVSQAFYSAEVPESIARHDDLEALLPVLLHFEAWSLLSGTCAHNSPRASSDIFVVKTGQRNRSDPWRQAIACGTTLLVDSLEDGISN